MLHLNLFIIALYFIHMYCMFCAVCRQLLMDSQMNRKSFKKWPSTLQPMKWLHTWQSGTRRYVGWTHRCLHLHRPVAVFAAFHLKCGFVTFHIRLSFV